MLLLAVLSALAQVPPDTEVPQSPTCRIHTDSAKWSYYAWRKAFTPASNGSLSIHPYAVCSAGRGPWAFTASNLTVGECGAKCTELGCTCFDYFCQYHEAADCKCPTVPPVHPLPSATKVACVGDSITAGYLSSCGLDYPAQLQSLLGEKFAVANYGVGGTTLLRRADHPYWNTSNFEKATSSNADVVVIMLGTNDAKKNNWEHLAPSYPADYQAMLDVFASMASRPRILIMTPPPLYKDGRYGMLRAPARRIAQKAAAGSLPESRRVSRRVDTETAINSDLPKLVPQVATAGGLPPPIDLFGLWERHCPIASGTPGHPPNATDTPCDWIGCGGGSQRPPNRRLVAALHALPSRPRTARPLMVVGSVRGGAVDACHPDNVGYGKIAAAVRDAILRDADGSFVDVRVHPGTHEAQAGAAAEARGVVELYVA